MTDTLYIFYNQQQEFICLNKINKSLYISDKNINRAVFYERKEDIERDKKKKSEFKRYNINIDDFIITPIKLNMELV
jgi:hypothetical protein